MRYAILGDIHGNLSALRTVLEDIARANVDRVFSVGDVVGYGAAPSQCISLLRELEVEVVKGNHDAACVGELDMTFFNPYARAAVEWTREHLSEEELRWLEGLPLTRTTEHCSIAHGTFAHPERFDYVQSPTDADPSLDLLERPVCFVGHTHVPVTILRTEDDPLRTGYTIESSIDLSDSVRALVNVGSVGQPRDEDSRTGWALYDASSRTVEIRRLEYDIEQEASRIRAAGLPPMLADRLYLGV